MEDGGGGVEREKRHYGKNVFEKVNINIKKQNKKQIASLER